MILNIYEKEKVVKTYETAVYHLKWGTMEDVAKYIDLDSLTTGTQQEIVTKAFNLLKNGSNIVNELMCDIFDGLTETELRKAILPEILTVIVEVVTYTLQQLPLGDGKNALGLKLT